MVAPHYYKPKDIQDSANRKMPRAIGATSEDTHVNQT